jgi:hypothetical protein
MQGHQWELHMAVRVLQEFGICRAFPPFYQEISKVFTLGYQAFTECYPEKEYITIAAFSYLRKACLKSITSSHVMLAFGRVGHLNLLNNLPRFYTTNVELIYSNSTAETNV